MTWRAAALVFLVAAAYPLAVYPALVALLARLRPRRWHEAPGAGPAMHLITVFNEARRIRTKLDNALTLESPAGGVELVVASDGSTDETEAIVRDEYAGRGVRLVAYQRRGKEQAQLDAIRSSEAAFVVFSDASTLLDGDALQRILEPFADPRVAAVSGTDRLASAGGVGEDLYIRYEMALRRAESLAGSLVGLSGCFFAARREVTAELLPDVPSDLGAALVAIGQGRRAVASEAARCAYHATEAAQREFSRKRRTALRGLRCLWAYRRALRSGGPIAAWQVVSHKWMRFLVPCFLVGAVVSVLAGAAAGDHVAQVLAAGLIAVAAVAAVSLSAGVGRGLAPVRALGFFMLTNLAVLAAWKDWATGVGQAKWDPTSRP